MADLLHRTETPTLHQPLLIMGWDGWTNAGEVATGVLGYLKEKLPAKKFAELDSDTFYQFTHNRPMVAFREGKLRSFTYPRSELFYWRDPKERQDAVLLIGAEPDLRWPTYVNLVLDLAQELGVARIYTVGGFYDSVPHTRDTPCTGGSDDPAMADELKHLRVDASSYVGPTGIVSAFVHEAKQRNMPAASLWARAPHYVQLPNPKAWHGVLWRLLGSTRLPVDAVPLLKRAQAFEQQLTSQLEGNRQLSDHVRELEQHTDATTPHEPLRQDDILRSVEDFFRQPPDEPPR
jgi:proteasome assembly chaperone (PAC2) family protein